MSTATSPEPVVLEVAELASTEGLFSHREENATQQLATRVLLFSFLAAVFLAITGFAAVACYLFLYLHHAFATFNEKSMSMLVGMNIGKMEAILLAHASLWKFILQSCGIICGAAFGFLGFALFLLGAKGDMDAAFQDSQHKVQLERMAPGSFVIFIAAILIGVCSIHPVKLEFFPAVDPSLPISNRAGTLLDSGSNANNDPTQDPNVMPNSGSNGSAGDAFHGGLTTTIPDPKTKGKGK